MKKEVLRSIELFFEEGDDFDISLYEVELRHGFPDKSTKKKVRGATGEERRAYRDGEKAGIRLGASRIKKHIDDMCFGR